jgi:hypothetical protein
MDKFFKKLLVFGMLFTAYTIGMLAINNFIIAQKKIKISTHTNILIAGDSHMQKAVVPTEFKNALSIAQTAEPYHVTYWKLKFLETIYSYDTLIVGFSHHNFSSFNDLKFSNKIWSTEMYKRTYLTNRFEYFSTSYYSKKEYYKTYFEHMCIYPNFSHFKFMGGYKNINLSKIEDYQKAINRHFYINGVEAETSQIQIAYLDSIYQFCTTNNIELILTSSPIHTLYRNKIPKEYVSLHTQKINEFKNQNVLVINQYQANYSDDEYLNTDHLNVKGAMRYTRELIRQIK